LTAVEAGNGRETDAHPRRQNFYLARRSVETTVLGDVLAAVESRQKTLTVFNYDRSRRLTENVERYFSLRNVEVTTGRTRPVSPSDFVLLHDEERIVAASDLSALRDHLLAESTAEYVTGERPLDDIEYPDVVTGLDDTVLTVAGEQTLLMVKLSRYVETLADDHGTGTLRAGFQRLDRLTAEPATRRVYRRLAAAGVDVHAYGHPGESGGDGHPATDDEVGDDSHASTDGGPHREERRSDDRTLSGVTTHAEPVPELADCWFVVYDGDGRPEDSAALLAGEREDGFYGFWTFDHETVERIDAYLARAY
jgi:hypothetical protein